MVLENLKGKRILLASKSPRRHYLLKELGIEFETVDNFQDDEFYPEEMPIEEIPVFLPTITLSGRLYASVLISK